MNRLLQREEPAPARRSRTIVIPLADRFDAAVRRRYTDAGGALTELIHEVSRFNALLASAQNRLMRDIGLNWARCRVLALVALAGRPQPVAQLARLMRLTRQSVQVLVNDLEKHGYLSFTRDGRKQQAKGVILTSKGLAGHRTATRRQVPWANRIADGLGEREIAEAARVVRLLVKRLTSEEAETARRPSERCGFSAKRGVTRAQRAGGKKRSETAACTAEPAPKPAGTTR